MADYLQGIIESHLNRLLCSREYPKTICPSEVSRALSTQELHDVGVSNWRDLMPEVRRILWGMHSRGELEILQKGNPLPLFLGEAAIKGPIRARKIR